ncbi:CPBP family intramembrane glutamic endopeptidase [Halorientalis halophila]|uniref:CPBP family intramembrane glutamic endopeptidase n=1 Tax=Halorientalis halophila TaxID=3108499 RepID=UPI00300A791F
MPQWTAFVGLTGVVLTLLLALARLSQYAVRGNGPASDDDAPEQPESRDPDDAYPTFVPPEGDAPDPVTRERSLRTDGDLAATPTEGGPAAGPDQFSTGALLANVALTQGLFGAILLGGAWYFEIPAWAFGVSDASLSTGLPAVGVGIVVGVSLYAVNEVGAASADAMGVEYDERLRSLLAPESATGWLILLFLVLPIIAGVEEFIFRAAVIGATGAGFDTSPWALAVVSSLAFALGHGAQGRVGVAVTGALGFVLAAAFVLTGSFLVVFVAHYLVNALEFVVHELLGIEWAGGAGSDG